MKHLPFVLAILVLSSILFPEAAQRPFAGRWNMTGTGEDSGRVYWLEIREDGGQLTGMFLNRTGSPTPLQSVKVEEGELVFQPRGGRGAPAPEFRARLQGDKLIGTVSQGERTISFVGVRPPQWPQVDAGARHQFGRPVTLFDGSSLDAFDVQHRDRPSGWSVEEGTMTNGTRANNLVSKERFTDFRILAEYKVTTGTNSGIYLRGRYELQVLDDHGKPPDRFGHMAIYGWVAPLINASRAPGEWQTLEATIAANRVTAVLNGQQVHDNTEIQAITGGALDADETTAGPVMIQGDHSQVWFRKLVVTPIVTVGR